MKDPAGYRLWAEQHDYCMCCGVSASAVAWPGMSTHHIVKPGRSDEPCNYLRLCMSLCHELVERGGIRIAGLLLPRLTLANCLWLKMVRDPETYDPARLAVLFHRALPEPEQPCGYLIELWRRNRGGGQISDPGTPITVV